MCIRDSVYTHIQICTHTTFCIILTLYVCMCVSLSNLNVTYGEVLMNLMVAISMMDKGSSNMGPRCCEL